MQPIDILKIKLWLESQEITNYEIEPETSKINVFQNVEFRDIDGELPYKFGVISGMLVCNGGIKSFKNFPDHVLSLYMCNNTLSSLEGIPKVDSEITLISNQIESLYGCSEEINNNFYISGNPLKSLEYAPKIVHGRFNCKNCQINSLEFCPESVWSLDCSENKMLESLKGSPRYVGGYFNCSNCPNLKSLKMVSKKC
jgi:hypothetical protein